MIKVNYKKATDKDLENIVNFLSQPCIKDSFIKPLDDRGISIYDRVQDKYKVGHWLVAETDKIVGVIAIIPNPHDIEISTYAVDVRLRGHGIGTKLLDYAYSETQRLFPQHSYITLDSWSGNPAISKLMDKMNYTLIRQFDDPVKRPEGYQTVIYIKSLK